MAFFITCVNRLLSTVVEQPTRRTDVVARGPTEWAIDAVNRAIEQRKNAERVEGKPDAIL